MAIRPCLRIVSLFIKASVYHNLFRWLSRYFEREPEKYVPAWLPVNQILQGNCGGLDLENMLREYYRFNVGADNLDIEGSPDQQRWKKWKGDAA